jgi:DNA polymerase-1
MNTLLLVDGNAIMHRAYHAIPPFRTKSGVPTNVIYGFFGMVSRAIEHFAPTNVIIAFDTPAKTFREQMLPSYQAHRPGIDDDFKEQIPLLKELLDVAGLCHMERDGFEADDIIGTLSKQAAELGYTTYIFTGDRDIMQLVDEHTIVVSPQTGMSRITIYDEAAVTEKMGVKPPFISDFKALAGDPSDNYRGADGIGTKTAIALVLQFGHIDSLLENIEKIEKPSVRRIVEEYVETIKQSKIIATIKRDVEGIELDEIASTWSTFPEALKAKLEAYEMKTLVSRLFSPKAQTTKKATTPYVPREAPAPPPQSDQLELF